MMIASSLLLLLLALIGAPLFVIIGASAMWGFYQLDIGLTSVILEIFSIAETPILLAIPLFTLAGYLLGESGAPGRLVRFTEALLGWVPGGLPILLPLVGVWGYCLPRRCLSFCMELSPSNRSISCLLQVRCPDC